MDFTKLTKERASIRKYSSKKVAIEKALEAIDTANLAPSPGNLPIIRYILVEDQDKIEKIAQACQQPFISQSNLLIILCSDSKQIDRLYDKRANTYIKQHAGAVIQTLLLKITDLKLASCWVGAFSEETIQTTLHIPDGISIEAVIPLAYQHGYDKTKQKYKPTLDNRIFFESYGNKHKVPYGKVGAT